MRGSQVIESARLHKMGFPEIMSNVEFVRRFGLLGDSSTGQNNLEGILSDNDIDPASYRIGPSQVRVFSKHKNIYMFAQGDANFSQCTHIFINKYLFVSNRI